MELFDTHHFKLLGPFQYKRKSSQPLQFYWMERDLILWGRGYFKLRVGSEWFLTILIEFGADTPFQAHVPGVLFKGQLQLFQAELWFAFVLRLIGER